MKRLPHVAMMLVAVSLLAADKTVKEKSDFEKIQGKWIVVELYAGGEKEKLSKEDKNETITFTLSGKKLTSSTNGDKSAVELRPDKRPRELDRTNGRGEVTPAIYELSGDTLKFCVSLNDVRPKKMGTGPDDLRIMFVLKRVKGDGKK